MAARIQLHIEELIHAQILHVPPSRGTAQWLAGLAPSFAEKLARAGLIEPAGQDTLGAFTRSYIDKRVDIKPKTRLGLELSRRRLIAFFGADRPLGSITPGDMDDWVVWLKERLASSTIAATIKQAKQFFGAAIRHQKVPNNPLEGIKLPKQTNEARMQFIDRPAIDKILAASSDREWQLIVALARYGGLRIPSEIRTLRWEDIRWELNRFYVSSPKTVHHGKQGRWVPIFPELRPYLEQAWEEAPEGEEFVLQRYRTLHDAALRTRMMRVCRRAGVTPWPRIFHNLRSSRETELAAEYPIHVVCAWIGNSAAIAAKHYLQVRDEDFERAAKDGAGEGGALHNPEQSGAEYDGQEGT